jgi:DNA-binding XRE family transcriptional regulator
MKNYKLIGARMTKGYNQQKMAELMGMSKGSYFKKETGKTEFYVSEILRLLEILDAKFEDIFM